MHGTPLALPAAKGHPSRVAFTQTVSQDALDGGAGGNVAQLLNVNVIAMMMDFI